MNYDKIDGYLVDIFNNVVIIEEASLKNSKFNDVSLKEMHTIDVIGTHPDTTPSAVAKELMLTLGTVTTSLNKLEKTVSQLIKKLNRSSVNSFKAIKEMVWESEFAGWENYAKLELDLQKSLAFTEDFKEGVRAYSERRRPKFQGK